jgi:hypothetical protein
MNRRSRGRLAHSRSSPACSSRRLQPAASPADRERFPPATAIPSPLPGSPKRKLREYASLYRKPHHFPSARASGFKERDRQTSQTGNQLPGT